MATGNTGYGFNLPFPIAEDPVNVHGDIEQLAERLRVVLPSLGISAFQMNVKNVSGITLEKRTPVYVTTSANGVTHVNKAIASTSQPILGLLKEQLENNEQGLVIVAGVLDNINTSDLSPAGSVVYVGESGGLTVTRPTGGSGAVGIVANVSAATGIIIVEAKGNGTWGALKNGLS